MFQKFVQEAIGETFTAVATGGWLQNDPLHQFGQVSKKLEKLTRSTLKKAMKEATRNQNQSERKLGKRKLRNQQQSVPDQIGSGAAQPAEAAEPARTKRMGGFLSNVTSVCPICMLHMRDLVSSLTR